MNQETYRKLISGQTESVSAVIVRLLLLLPAHAYATIIAMRNFLYDRKWLKVHQPNAVVISIGNITAGGTGKTPLVVWLAKQMSQKCACAILTRGYKATENSKLKTQNYSDEPEILAKNCPSAKIIINPDRAAGAQEAIKNYHAQVLIMDDGFQHRKLARNLDIIAIDATCPFGYGRILPAGLLRETPASLKRADAVVITRSDQVNKGDLENIEAELRHINPEMLIARAIHNPVSIQPINAEQFDIEQIRGKKIFAFCGIGNPGAFLNTIRKTNANLVGSKVFNDHHAYTDADIADIHEEARYLAAQLILSTQKDWTKISAKKLPADITFACLVMELKFTDGEDKLKQLIEKTLAGRI